MRVPNRVCLTRPGGPLPDLHSDGALGWIPLGGPAAGLAASHLQGPEKSVTQRSDHLLSLVSLIEADSPAGVRTTRLQAKLATVETASLLDVQQVMVRSS